MKDFSYGPNKLGVSIYQGLTFGLAKLNEDKVEVVDNFYSCRDGLLGRIHTNIIHTNIEKIKTDKTHMLLQWCAGSPAQLSKAQITENNLKNQKWIENSIKFLHLYEKLAGWPLTKTHRVKTDNDDATKLYYFLSSRRWIKAPYLISLYVLLIRIGRFDYFDKFKTYKDLTSVVDKLSKTTGPTTDERYIIETFKYWKTIATCYPDLFRKKKIEYYWSNGNLSSDSYIGYEGISYLSGGTTRNKTLYDKFMKLHNEG